MDNEELAALARSRALVDDKGVKKLVQLFYKLVAGEHDADALLGAHASLLALLDQLRTYYSKGTRLEYVTQREVLTYQNEVAQIGTNHAQSVLLLEQLKERLVSAQLERANKIEYDIIAKKINKLPSREQGVITNAKLLNDIEQLKEEQTTYAATWQSRQDAFDGIVNGLAAMSEAIRDEKSEQERRRALDDAEEDELAPAAVPPPATATSGTSTPKLVEPDAAAEDVSMTEVEPSEKDLVKEPGEMELS